MCVEKVMVRAAACQRQDDSHIAATSTETNRDGEHSGNDGQAEREAEAERGPANSEGELTKSN